MLNARAVSRKLSESHKSTECTHAGGCMTEPLGEDCVSVLGKGAAGFSFADIPEEGAGVAGRPAF